MSNPYGGQQLGYGQQPGLGQQPGYGQPGGYSQPGQSPFGGQQMYSQQAYAPPGYGAGPENLAGAGYQLIGMRPWVMISGICGIIGAGINLVQSLVSVGVGAAGMGEVFGSILGAGIALALAGLLLKFGGSISAYQRAQSPQQFEAALEAQLAYWRLLGILTIIFVSLILVFVLLGIAVGMAN